MRSKETVVLRSVRTSMFQKYDAVKIITMYSRPFDWLNHVILVPIPSPISCHNSHDTQGQLVSIDLVDIASPNCWVMATRE